MKFIKKYENFVNDENRSKIAEEPEYNPVKRLAAKNYVDLIFNKGSGAEVNALCKEIGKKSPQNDEELEALKEDAIKYYIDNPERIKDTDQPITKYDYYGGSKVAPTTNNVGGTSQANSTHIGESVKNKDKDEFTKIEISDEEMDLFGNETLLIKLIGDNKISLHNNEVSFKTSDDETKKILDIFFDIDK